MSLNDKIEKQKISTVTEEIIRIEKPAGIDHFYVMEMLD